MTDKEKAIVMAYTGIAMLTGDKFDIFHRYIQEKLGRPIYTHELAFEEIWGQINEATKEDFKRLCKEGDDAIPIEWMKNYARKICTDDDGRYNSKAYGIDRMIYDWEKENEIDRCG